MGHALNIILGIMSGVVHGLRLNSFTYGANWISPSTPCVRFNFAQKPLRNAPKQLEYGLDIINLEALPQIVVATLVGRQKLSSIHRYICNRANWLYEITQTQKIKPISRAHRSLG
jgi:hypothetical protein